MELEREWTDKNDEWNGAEDRSCLRRTDGWMDGSLPEFYFILSEDIELGIEKLFLFFNSFLTTNINY